MCIRDRGEGGIETEQATDAGGPGGGRPGESRPRWHRFAAAEEQRDDGGETDCLRGEDGGQDAGVAADQAAREVARAPRQCRREPEQRAESDQTTSVISGSWVARSSAGAGAGAAGAGAIAFGAGVLAAVSGGGRTVTCSARSS